MDVIYYTQACYLDAALETIKTLKEAVNLHVFIEIAPESKSSNIIDIANLEGFNFVEPFENVMGAVEATFFNNYFEGVSSVKFVIHKHKKSFSVLTLWNSMKLSRLFKNTGACHIHFDSITVRSMGLLPFIYSLKIFITIHDPVAHLGEHSWKRSFTNKVFFLFTNGFFFYSKYAKWQFESLFPNESKQLHDLRLQPYCFNKQFVRDFPHNSKSILFFGRLSYYKGIDLLLEAIPMVLKYYPDQIFIIAGKSDGYDVDLNLIKSYPDNIVLINKHLNPAELANLIVKSKFIVCPYRDASQSGVLMTAKALGKVVLASNIGAFPEYIHDGENGILMEPNATSIAQHIIQMLHDNKYLQLETSIDTNFSNNISLLNRHFIMNAYNAV